MDSQIPEDLQNGLDDGNYRQFIQFFGGNANIADRFEVYLHASQSITIPDYPENVMYFVDQLFIREDLNNYQIVQELDRILPL